MAPYLWSLLLAKASGKLATAFPFCIHLCPYYSLRKVVISDVVSVWGLIKPFNLLSSFLLCLLGQAHIFLSTLTAPGLQGAALSPWKPPHIGTVCSSVPHCTFHTILQLYLLHYTGIITSSYRGNLQGQKLLWSLSADEKAEILRDFKKSPRSHIS